MSLPFRYRVRRFVIVLTVLLIALTLLTRWERRRTAGTATTAERTPAEGVVDGESVLADIRQLASPQFEGRHTGTAGSRLAQEFIVERLRRAGAAPLFGDSYRQPFSFTRTSIRALFSGSQPYRRDYADAANLGAIVRGTFLPERYLVLSAHYDHFGIRDGQLFPGADDNASGVAVLLAAAQALSRHGLRHSLVLLAFDAEELGLRGAKHFVEQPPIDVEKVDTIVNLDMVGRGDANTLVAAGTSYNPHLEAPIRAAAEGRGLQVVFGHDRPIYKAGRVGDWTHSSDHGPFHDAGVPFVYLGVEDHADYHQASDTADKIAPRFVAEVGALVVALLRHLDALAAQVPR